MDPELNWCQKYSYRYNTGTATATAIHLLLQAVGITANVQTAPIVVTVSLQIGIIAKRQQIYHNTALLPSIYM